MQKLSSDLRYGDCDVVITDMCHGLILIAQQRQAANGNNVARVVVTVCEWTGERGPAVDGASGGGVGAVRRAILNFQSRDIGILLLTFLIVP